MILRVSPDEPCSEDKKLHQKKESSEIIRAFFLLVELEGIEPSSVIGPAGFPSKLNNIVP